MCFKRNRISNLQRKLANVGVEKTPNEIWDDVLLDCDGDEELAGILLMELDNNSTSFMNFANHVSGRRFPVAVESVKYVPYRVKEYVNVFVGQELVLVGSLVGFLLGVLVSLVFKSWVKVE